MTPGDIHLLIITLVQLPVVGAFFLGVWYADKRAQQRGERVGVLENRVKDLEDRRPKGHGYNQG